MRIFVLIPVTLTYINTVNCYPRYSFQQRIAWFKSVALHFKGDIPWYQTSTEDVEEKAGHIMYHDAFVHLPINLGDKPLELVQIELKR